MNDEIKTATEMSDDALDNVAGGSDEYYLGSDKYTIAEYNQAGVTWEHNFLSKDRYFILGQNMSQKWAEKCVDMFRQINRPLTREDLRLMGVPGF
jgi:phage FluMu gp28-like protein